MLSLKSQSAQNITVSRKDTYLDIVVDDLKQTARTCRDVVDDLTQGCIGEGLGDTAGVDGDHRVIGTVLGVALDSTLYCDATVEDGVNERADGKNLGDTSAEYSPANAESC